MPLVEKSPALRAKGAGAVENHHRPVGDVDMQAVGRRLARGSLHPATIVVAHQEAKVGAADADGGRGAIVCRRSMWMK